MRSSEPPKNSVQLSRPTRPPLYVERDSRFTLISQPNAGLSLARNAALAQVSGTFICPLDADDVYLPHFLASQHEFIHEHPGFDVYSCNVDAWMPDGSRSRFPLSAEYDAVAETRLDDFLDANRFTVITVVRATALRHAGGFRKIAQLEDYDLWLRMAADGSRMLHNPLTLALYRQRPGSKQDNYVGALLAQCEALRYLLATADLDMQTRVRALASIGRLEPAAARAHLENRLRAGVFAHARRLFWKTRRTYSGRRALLADAVRVTLSPRAYARALRDRPIRGSRFGERA
ncbi:MAG: glycosyltransferase [Thermoleophilia bacterium]